MLLAIAGMLYSVHMDDMGMFFSLVIYFFALIFVAFIGFVRSYRVYGAPEAEAFGMRWDFPASLGRIGIGFLSAGLLLFLVSDFTKVYAYVPSVFLSMGGTIFPMVIAFLFYMFVVGLIENQMCITIAEAIAAPFSSLKRLVLVVALIASLGSAAFLSILHFSAYGFNDVSLYVFAFLAFFLWMLMYYVFNGDAIPGIVSHGWYDFCVILSWSGFSSMLIFGVTVAVALVFLVPWFLVGAYRHDLSLWRSGYGAFE